MSKHIYQGRLAEHEYGEAYALFIEGDDEPLVKRIMADLGIDEDENEKTQVESLGFYISDKPKTKDQHVENHIRKMAGDLTADYRDVWSDVTGYLWTDETLEIGGHNIIDELKEHLGKYLYMEISAPTPAQEVGNE